MKNHFSLCLILLICMSSVFGQQPPKVKFQKVSEEEIKMSVYEPDTAAVAVILFDEGTSDVAYDRNNGFMLTHDRFVRIKILKQAGTVWGNFSIPLYAEVSNNEEIRGIKGFTFNYENGKIQETEMKKESIFREKENKYWDNVRFSLPSVKVGSVIDLKYSIHSPLLWNLRTWKFQYTIPVKWSSYRVIYPEYFKYNHSSTGYYASIAQKQSTRNDNIEQNINYISKIFDYSVSNVAAAKEEPYMSTLENYITKMKFELANINAVAIGGRFKSFTTTWEAIAQGLIDDFDFGGEIKSANYASNIIETLLAGKTDEKQKMTALYSYIQQTIKWNGSTSYMPSKTLKKVFAEKIGNSADINLLLTALLKEARIEVDPVILSTRENGFISLTHPSLSDCNYVIARAIINGNPVLLDATEPLLQAGLIPFRCLNGTGRLIKKEQVQEIELKNTKSTKNTMINIENKDGKFGGLIFTRDMGMNAFDFRKAVKDAGGQQEYFNKLKNQSSELEMKDYTYLNLDSIYLPLTRKYNIILPNESEDTELLYFNPVLTGRTTKNPFTAPTRVYPVDFGVPFTEIYQLNLRIPKGYKVEEIPQNKSFGLAEKTGSYIYQISQTDSLLSLSTRISIDKALFLPSEYENLREFYNMIVAKEAEQIVLKKVN